MIANDKILNMLNKDKCYIKISQMKKTKKVKIIPVFRS